MYTSQRKASSRTGCSPARVGEDRPVSVRKMRAQDEAPLAVADGLEFVLPDTIYATFLFLMLSYNAQ